MIYLSVQPDDSYHRWQLINFINNAKSLGIDEGDIYIVLIHQYNNPSKEIELLYSKVNIYYYQDERPLLEIASYPPSIKPYGMMLFSKENPGLKNVFYHDADIIFLKKIENLSGFVGSNVDSYLGIDYLEEVDKSFLSYVKMKYDLKEQDIESLREKAVGAQLFFETLPEYFLWEQIYNDSYTLYTMMLMQPSKIQKWCAEMWSTWFVLFYQGYDLDQDEKLDFAFPTDSLKDCENKNILHNAGIQSHQSKDFFFKGDYIEEHPYTSKIERKRYDKSKASYLYYQSVKDTYSKYFKKK